MNPKLDKSLPPFTEERYVQLLQNADQVHLVLQSIRRRVKPGQMTPEELGAYQKVEHHLLNLSKAANDLYSKLNTSWDPKEDRNFQDSR